MVTNKRSKLITGAILVAVVVTGGAIASAAPGGEKGKPDVLPIPVVGKVTICHATESDKNPWVRTVVSANATAGHFDNNGNPDKGHEGDKLLQGDVACPVVVVTPPEEEEPEEEVKTPETPSPVVTAPKPVQTTPEVEPYTPQTKEEFEAYYSVGK